MNRVIEVKNLTKKFKDLTAVDDLSFNVNEGDVYGFFRTEWCRKINNHKDVA